MSPEISVFRGFYVPEKINSIFTAYPIDLLSIFSNNGPTFRRITSVYGHFRRP